MPPHYLDTPATEREDVSLAQLPALDFSAIQPYGSPSKNPAEDLRNKMRGLRNGGLQQPPLRTPRVRNVLLDRRNTAAQPAKQEFTPLLKSAKRKELVRRSIVEEKENVLSSGIPEMPAAFRSSYVADDTQLPLHSSMLDETAVSDSITIERGARVDNPVSSSMLSSTPMPSLPKDGQGGVLDQGNILTLRDQEAKLDQIQKDNFGLKLKIHYLEEALRKTGSEFHQATLKENAELKTERATIEVDLKRLRKRLQLLERELEEQRQRCLELTQNLAGRGADQTLAKQLADVQRLADARLKVADDRLEELEDLQTRLRQAEEDRAEDHGIQALQDDIEDLKRDIHDRDNQLDAKEEEIDALKDRLSSVETDSPNLEHMQQDIDDLEAELKERDEELDIKNAKLAQLEEQANSVYDREKSTQKLRADVVGLESQLRQKSQELDDALEQGSILNKRLSAVDSTHVAEIGERDQQIARLRAQFEATESGQASARDTEEELRSIRRELSDKDGELRALQERLETAREGWDTEAQQTDARLQEKDRQIRDRDSRLRERAAVIDQRDDELNDLQKRLRAAEYRRDEVSTGQTDKEKVMMEQIRDLEQSARSTERSLQARIAEKDNLLQAREAELKTLNNRLASFQQADSATTHVRNEIVQHLETTNRRLEKQNQDHVSHIASLQRRADAMETPSRKDGLIKEYSEQVRSLREELRKIEQDKDIELDGLEQELSRVEQEKRKLQDQARSAAALQLEVDRLVDGKLDMQKRLDQAIEKARNGERDQSVLGHQSTELDGQRIKISQLEGELSTLQAKCMRHESKLRLELDGLRDELTREHRAVRQTLEDEVVVLEASLDEADAERQSFAGQVQALQQELQSVQSVRSQETPAKQRRELRANLAAYESERSGLAAKIADLEKELHDAQQPRTDSTIVKEHVALSRSLETAQSHMETMQNQIDALERELEKAKEERTIADERQDLHDLVKSAKIDAEQLRIKLAEREKKLASYGKRESDLYSQLETSKLAAEDLRAIVVDLEARLSSYAKREASMRAQTADLRETKSRIDELEQQVDDRNGSSNGHVRRETELRAQLRNAKATAVQLQTELADKDDELAILGKREQGLQHRLRQQIRPMGDNTVDAQFSELKTQLASAQRNVQNLQLQLLGRDKTSRISRKSYTQLAARSTKAEDVIEHNESGFTMEPGSKVLQTRHKQEMKGLAKQIRFLQAKCEREARLRRDLIYVKQWFLLQVDMYNECNQADLRLLEEIGITPDETIRNARPSLRTAGLAVIATIRMRKLSAEWSSKKRSQEALVNKLETMKTIKARKSR